MTAEQEFNKIVTKKLLQTGFLQLDAKTFVSNDFKITLDDADTDKVFSIFIRNLNSLAKLNIHEFSSVRAYNKLDSFIITNCLAW